MQENEKSKKKTIEKLRMILDNPYSEDLHIENEKNRTGFPVECAAFC